MDSVLFERLAKNVCMGLGIGCARCPFNGFREKYDAPSCAEAWRAYQKDAEILLATWIGGADYVKESAKKKEPTKTPETRKEILQAAERCVCGGRELDHGTPEQSFHAIALHFTAFLESKGLLREGAKIDAADASAMLALFKVARVTAGNFVADSYVDACGYLACSGELAAEREKEGNI